MSYQTYYIKYKRADANGKISSVMENTSFLGRCSEEAESKCRIAHLGCVIIEVRPSGTPTAIQN